MSGDVHVRFCERLGVRLPRATRRVIPVRGHPTKRGGAERALPRLQAQLAPWGVALNREKTRGVNTRAGEAFGCRGCDRRRGRRGTGPGDGIRMTAKKKARQAMKAKVRDIVRPGGAPPAEAIVARIKGAWAGGVHYLRGGKARRAFREVRDYIEMKVRTLLRRRPRWRKRRVGGRRWSNEYLYEVRGLYGDWKVHPLPRAQAFP